MNPGDLKSAGSSRLWLTGCHNSSASFSVDRKNKIASTSDSSLSTQRVSMDDRGHMGKYSVLPYSLDIKCISPGVTSPHSPSTWSSPHQSYLTHTKNSWPHYMCTASQREQDLVTSYSHEWREVMIALNKPDLMGGESFFPQCIPVSA